MFQLSKRPRDAWVQIPLDDANSLEVLITRPTYDQMLADQSELQPRHIIAGRMKSIADWRGVEADGKPVPFSPEALADLFHSYPNVALNQFLNALRPFFETGETQRKNSAPPPSAATPESPSLPASMNSEPLPNSELPSG